MRNLLPIYKTDENNVDALCSLSMINLIEEYYEKAEGFFLKEINFDHIINIL